MKYHDFIKKYDEAKTNKLLISMHSYFFAISTIWPYMSREREPDSIALNVRFPVIRRSKSVESFNTIRTEFWIDLVPVNITFEILVLKADGIWYIKCQWQVYNLFPFWNFPFCTISYTQQEEKKRILNSIVPYLLLFHHLYFVFFVSFDI